MIRSLKTAARALWPSGYRYLGALKQRVTAPGWEYYFSAADPSLLVPERCAVWLADNIPARVDTILIIGCAPGRDFIPFQGKLKLRGFDLAPLDGVKWVCDASGLDYRQMTAQEFTRSLNEDLSKTLVYTCGTLMQITADEQRKLYATLKANGCRNFVFLEPPPNHFEFGVSEANRCFALPLSDFRAMPDFRNDGFVAFVSFTDTDTK